MSKPLYRSILRLLTVISLIGSSSMAFAQNSPNKGTDFWTAFMRHRDGTNARMSLYITSDRNTSGEISIPQSNWSTPFSVTKDKTTIINLPSNLTLIDCDDCVDKSIHITAFDSIVVYSHLYHKHRSDATLILPTGALGNEYFPMSFIQETQNGFSRSVFTAIAVEDNTRLEITPSVPTVSGRPANVPFEVVINRGEAYQLQTEADLTGTSVRSIGTGSNQCKRFAVLSGSSFTSLGCTNASSGDNLFEQVYATNTWGREYITIPLRGRSGGDYFRILASQDNTTISINGSTQVLQRGEYTDLLSDQTNYITGSLPISVAQFARTQSCDNMNGDPSMIMLVPLEQTLNQISLYASPFETIDDNYINVVMRKEDFPNFTLNGSPVAFAPVPSNPDYGYAQLSVAPGNHTLKAPKGFNAISYGFGFLESYGYAAGANIKNLNLSIQADKTVVCPDEAIAFQGVAQSNFDLWDWDFDDGSEATTQQTTYSFSQPGTYNVSLVGTKISANACDITSRDSVNQQIVVQPNPVTAFDHTATQYCELSEIVFDDNSTVSSGSSLITQWAWDFGDGNTATTANPKHQFTQAGTYNVSLTTTTNYTCQSSYSTTIDIKHTPVADFGPTTACMEDTILFTSSSSVSNGTITEWSWSQNSNQVEVQSTYQTAFDKPGFYPVTLRVNSDAFCADSIIQEITIYPKIQLAFQADPVCLEQPSVFVNQSFLLDSTLANRFESDISWQWTFGNNEQSSIAAPTHLYQRPGNYLIKLTASVGDLCEDQSQAYITVFPKPTANFNVLTEDISILDPVVEFENTSVEADSYLWQMGDGQLFNDKDLTHTYASAGYYDVFLIAENEFSCTDTAYQQVYVEPFFDFNIPTIFTPNADGLNDVFIPVYEGVESFSLDIVDRWGNKIYSSNNMLGWQGNFQDSSTPASDGVYVYLIQLIDYKGRNRTYSGQVTLLR